MSSDPAKPIEIKCRACGYQAIITAAAAGMLALTAMPASAAPWQSINQRQANIDRRIDQGERNGSLTRMEANRLRGEFRPKLRIEEAGPEQPQSRGNQNRA